MDLRIALYNSNLFSIDSCDCRAASAFARLNSKLFSLGENKYMAHEYEYRPCVGDDNFPKSLRSVESVQGIASTSRCPRRQFQRRVTLNFLLAQFNRGKSCPVFGTSC